MAANTLSKGPEDDNPAPVIVAVTYICGNCGCDVELKPTDAVRCRECGHRVLFKKRCAKPMQFQAI
eukprot:CAMPEP_0194478618 /NCGR_PEP_ID=MMETSP0253-20130528/2004_1 /TAXON_ID=2966 /ORGANISM="Noctiluca scintillans" /LENGTH=65 /DNA_ID=CAMNT_0039317731 /DNA_START=66 /DNA_END=263 /DNA_ORIENTATION=+